MAHIKRINEWYKNPEDYLFDSPVEVPMDYTYLDDVFDRLVCIICEENAVKKGTKEAQNIEDYVEGYFDNNDEILQEIDKAQQEKKRPQFCAEELYFKHFKNKELN